MWIGILVFSSIVAAQISDPWLMVKPTLLLEFDNLTTRLRKLQAERDFPSFDAIDTRLAEIHFKERAKLHRNVVEDPFFLKSVRHLLEKSLGSGQVWTWPEAWSLVGCLPHAQRDKFIELEGHVLQQDYSKALGYILEEIQEYEQKVSTFFVLPEVELQSMLPVLQPLLEATLQANPGFSDLWRNRQMKRYQETLRKDGRGSYLDQFGPDFGFWELFARTPAYSRKNPVPLLGLTQVTDEGREFPRALLSRFIWVSMWEHLIEGFSLTRWLEYYRQAFQVLDPLLTGALLECLAFRPTMSPDDEAKRDDLTVLHPESLLDLYQVTHVLFYGFQIPKPFPTAWEDCFPSRRTAIARSKFFMQARLETKPLSGATGHPEGLDLPRIVAVLRSWFQLWVQKSVIRSPTGVRLALPLLEELFVRSYLKLTKDWQQVPSGDGFAFSFKFLDLPVRYFISDGGLLVSEDVGFAGWFVEKRI